MYLTYLDNNTWLIEIGNKKILLDPWLVGDLTFANLAWFFKARRLQERLIPENINLILLSQGLEDHAHSQTLKQLDRHIPVVASVNATKIVTELGYTQIITLTHGDTFSFGQSLEITAVPGSPIGPMLLENGYLLKEIETGFSLYYEPHGYHSPLLKKFAPVDVIITPLVDLALPIFGSFIYGRKKALEVTQWLQPQVVVPTTCGCDVIFEGFLASAIKTIGTIEEFCFLLKQNEISAQVLKPQPEERIPIHLSKRKVEVN